MTEDDQKAVFAMTLETLNWHRNVSYLAGYRSGLRHAKRAAIREINAMEKAATEKHGKAVDNQPLG